MPELPDILVYIGALEARVLGQPLERVRLASPFLLRTTQPPVALTQGRKVRELRRVGKRIAIGVEGDLWLVLHLMIAGRLHWRPPNVRLAGRQTLAAFDFPQGSLTLWHSLRRHGEPTLQSAVKGIDRVLVHAEIEGYQWVFIDTAPTTWVVVQEAIRVATMVVIPARPGFFDLAAVAETVKACRERDKPYAVVINAAPVKREVKESQLVTQSRNYFDERQIPVWAGQISQRAGYQSTLAAGASAAEIGPSTPAGAEIAQLWSAIERSIEAINAAQFAPGAAANADQAMTGQQVA